MLRNTQDPECKQESTKTNTCGAIGAAVSGLFSESAAKTGETLGNLFGEYIYKDHDPSKDMIFGMPGAPRPK